MQIKGSLITSPTKDPIGMAVLDYLDGKTETNIIAACSVAEDDIIPPSYFFRTYAKTSELERLALHHVVGKVLDIGAGAGCHSLYLQEKGFDVTALDVSPGAVKAMERQGIKQAHHADVMQWQSGPYDTLLMLMNGIGLVETLNGLVKFLTHAKKLLKPGGQIILDSTDVLYVYQLPDGSVKLNLAANYYGEVTYQVTYKSASSKPFGWLYIDQWMLTQHTAREGFGTEILHTQDDEHYLARLYLPPTSGT